MSAAGPSRIANRPPGGSATAQPQASGDQTRTLHPRNETLTRGERVALALYIVSSLAVFVLMMLLGLAMRMAQGTWIDIPPDVVYQIMTAHGAGMVG
ncbi:MAG: hypothetical protein ACHP7B_08595, partial [Burkholderiales bacterium]